MVLRFANLYGPYGKGFPEFGFVNYFVHLAWHNEEIKIFGNGKQTRNVLYVDDATELLWRAANNDRLIGETYLATGDEHLSVREIAETIVSVFGRGSVTHIDWPDERRRIEIDHIKFSSKRLRSLTGWRPRYDFKSALNELKAVLERTR